LRRELAGLHLSGSYTALDGGEHVVAFLREHEGQALACVVPRLPWKLTDGRVPWALGEAWGDRSLSLPAKRWTNVFTGERRAWSGRAPMGEILESFPVAVLTADGS
jgi:(1->4)-alpha-D-glucan 1-alpha-D-glucosylmutase